jgi:hypothetical protein
LLERAIEERPTAARKIIEKNGFAIYEKNAAPSVFETITYKAITIRYVLHIQTNTIILTDIF